MDYTNRLQAVFKATQPLVVDRAVTYAAYIATAVGLSRTALAAGLGGPLTEAAALWADAARPCLTEDGSLQHYDSPMPAGVVHKTVPGGWAGRDRDSFGRALQAARGAKSAVAGPSPTDHDVADKHFND